MATIERETNEIGIRGRSKMEWMKIIKWKLSDIMLKGCIRPYEGQEGTYNTTPYVVSILIIYEV